MRIVTVTMVVALTYGVAGAAALDCARVKALHAEGKRPSDIARELGITTPDVQGCLAGEIEEQVRPAPAQAQGIPIGPGVPAADAPVPRPPNQ